MSTTAQTAAKAKANARDLAEKAKDTLKATSEEKAEAAQEAAAHEVQQVADAASVAADTFDTGTVQRQAMAQIADGIEGVAAQIRDTDLDSLSRKVSGFARENPLIFVGGAAVLGFAATRFLNARRPDQTSSYGPQGDDAWGSHRVSSRHAPSSHHDDQGVLSHLNGDRDA